MKLTSIRTYNVRIQRNIFFLSDEGKEIDNKILENVDITFYAFGDLPGNLQQSSSHQNYSLIPFLAAKEVENVAVYSTEPSQTFIPKNKSYLLLPYNNANFPDCEFKLLQEQLLSDRFSHKGEIHVKLSETTLDKQVVKELITLFPGDEDKYA